MEWEGPARVRDDLRRDFFRTLAELRRHQEWCLKYGFFDVTPNAKEPITV